MTSIASVPRMSYTRPLPSWWRRFRCLGLVFDWHTHSDHQLAWAASGVLTVRTQESAWVLPPTRALWIPAGLRHETLSKGTATMRSAYVRPARCRIGWAEPTPVSASPLLAEPDRIPRRPRSRSRQPGQCRGCARRRAAAGHHDDDRCPHTIRRPGEGSRRRHRRRTGRRPDAGSSGAGMWAPASARWPGRSSPIPASASVDGARSCGCRLRSRRWPAASQSGTLPGGSATTPTAPSCRRSGARPVSPLPRTSARAPDGPSRSWLAEQPERALLLEVERTRGRRLDPADPAPELGDIGAHPESARTRMPNASATGLMSKRRSSDRRKATAPRSASPN